MDDPQADAISLANLTDIECSVGRRWVGDTMLVADPTDHVARERLACPYRKSNPLAVDRESSDAAADV